MKLNSTKFINFYSVLTSVTLITVLTLILFSNSVNKYSRMKSESSTIYSEMLTIGLPLDSNKVENLLHSDDNLKSERNPNGKSTNANLWETDGQKIHNKTGILIYRKRRYLLFPEGSSFQIVFDLIIPIVDYTNYAIMGITCAVAWELPSKPPSEIADELLEKLNDGTFGLSRNDSVNNIKYIDTTDHQKPVSNIIYIQPSEYTYRRPPNDKTASHNQPQINSNGRIEYSNYNRYKPGPVYTKHDQKQPIYYKNTYNSPPFKLKSINNERIDTAAPRQTLKKQNYVQRPSVKGFSKATTEVRPSSRRQNNIQKQKPHAVYHIMGKRSIRTADEQHFKTEQTNPFLERLDRIHLQYHRSSRHTLYSKIEGMFYQQGKNGTECVLRALCETGQKKHETEPGTILVEILRAIFTLPKADDERSTKYYHPKHKAWDEAHSGQKNCSELYPLCENFIWNSEYMW